jgi:hypothetical protein
MNRKSDACGSEAHASPAVGEGAPGETAPPPEEVENDRADAIEAEVRRLLVQNRALRAELEKVICQPAVPAAHHGGDAAAGRGSFSLELTGRSVSPQVKPSQVPRSTSDRRTQSQLDARRRLSTLEQRHREVAARDAAQRRQLIPTLRWRDDFAADLVAREAGNQQHGT